MNNIYKLIFFLPFLLVGCKTNVIDESRLLQKIDSLDMDIFSNEGEKILSIKSPDSSYDKENLSFNLKQTTIKLYNDDKPNYIINSDESKMYDNNKVIELKGNVKLITVEKDNDVLFADNFIWNIKESNYLLVGNVKFENNNVILSSYKAILNSDNIIEFFNPVEYSIKNENNQKNYEIKSENAFYNIDTNSIRFGSKDKRVRTKLYF